MPLVTYTPDEDDAQGLSRAFPDMQEEDFDSHNPLYATIKFICKPLIDEVLALIRRVYNAETITAKTGNYTITIADRGKVFSNAGAAGTITLTLPTVADAAGVSYKFYKSANQTFRIETGLIGRAKFGDLTNAASYFELTTRYGFGEIISDGTNWIWKYGPTDLA